MWNRKAKRIAELEEKLRAAIEDQVTVQVHLPADITYQIKALPKGRWYHMSFQFKVAEDHQDFADVCVRDMANEAWNFFDGTQPFRYHWDGKPTDLEGD